MAHPHRGTCDWTNQKITIADGIAAILAMPASGEPLPAVLMLHGFGSSKDEVGGLYKTLADALAGRGIASLRIDFHGWGESSDDMSDTTIPRLVADAQAALRYLSGARGVDASRIGILGFSLGAAVAVVAAAQSPSPCKSLVLLSPTGDLGRELLAKYGQENFERAARDGAVSMDLGWRTVRLKSGFFQSLGAYDVSACARQYSGALLAIAGSKDYSAAHAKNLVAISHGHPRESFILAGSDHIFGILGQDKRFASAVVEKIVGWFADTL